MENIYAFTILPFAFMLYLFNMAKPSTEIDKRYLEYIVSHQYKIPSLFFNLKFSIMFFLILFNANVVELGILILSLLEIYLMTKNASLPSNLSMEEFTNHTIEKQLSKFSVLGRNEYDEIKESAIEKISLPKNFFLLYLIELVFLYLFIHNFFAYFH